MAVNLVPHSAIADEIDEQGEADIDITIQNNDIPLQNIPNITAKCGIGVDSATGRILFEKNAYSKMEMASTTKIMTGIIAIESGNLDDIVEISNKAVRVSGSEIGLKKGEKWILRSLLYGLLLSSGNDAAIAIAEYIAGSVDKFIEMMNNKAAEIGALNTCFKSPHGLDIAGHYSTAYDLSVITRYAFNNPIFNEIVCSKQSTVKAPTGNISMYNTNEMLTRYKGADGVKTGYTGKAGRCLVTSATRDNMRIVSVVLGCSSRNNRAADSSKILNYCFANYNLYTLINKNEPIGEMYVAKGTDKYCAVKIADTIKYVLTEDEVDRLEIKYGLPDKLEAPIKAGQKIGEILFCLEDIVIGKTHIVTDKSIKRKDIGYYITKFFEVWKKSLPA